MIAVLTCRCPNADIKAYRFLQKQIENWTDVPLFQGQEQCQQFLRRFVDDDNIGEYSLGSLQNHLSAVSRYIVIVGYSDHGFAWSDIERSDAKATIDAETIIKEFA